VKKVEAVQKVSHAKEEEVVMASKHIKKAAPKPEEPVKKAAKPAESKDKKPAKGSDEMRDRMKKLREMRKAKSDE
jgi:hypothetical protein